MNEIIYLIIIVAIAMLVMVGPELSFFRSGIEAHKHKVYAREARTLTERTVREIWDDTTPISREEITKIKNADYKPAEETTKTNLSPMERVKAMGGR